MSDAAEPESEPHEPDEREEPELLATRRAKLARLRAENSGDLPYAYPGTTSLAQLQSRYAELPPGEETDDVHRVAGRLAARRELGRAAFLDIVDRGPSRCWRSRCGRHPTSSTGSPTSRPATASASST
jgi:lysyl-tRNA synthetase class 2